MPNDIWGLYPGSDGGLLADVVEVDVCQSSLAPRLLWAGMVSRRGVSRLIDDLLVVGVQFASLLAGAFMYAVAAFGGDPPTSAVVLAWVVGISGFAASVVYEIVATRAVASLGKLICGLRLIDADSGTQLSLGRSILRWLLVSGVQPFGWLVFVVGDGTAPRDAVVLASLVAVALAWRTALAVSIITCPSAHQGLHDHVVHSRVVRSQPST